MADLIVWPTDAAEGSVATEARWRKMARLWVGTGVELKAGMMKPTLGAGPVIAVADGSCWIDGHYAELTAGTSVPVTTNGILVVRLTPADNKAELLYRASVTDPTQTDASYELPIARMSGGAMVDLRVYAVPALVAPDAATAVAHRSQIAGDVQPRSGVGLDSAGRGTVLFGPGGSGPPDAAITRTGAGALTVIGALTGSLTAPTKAADTATTEVATTAFVLGQAGTVAPNPVDDTAAAVGSSWRYARADHTHKLGAGVFDTTGVASRLNPMQIFTYFEAAGLALGDAGEYRLSDGNGWVDQSAGASLTAVPWDYDGYAAIGGTVQWRWWFAMNVAGAMGGTGRVLSMKYVNVAEGGASGSLLTVSGLSGISWSDSAGAKAFDSGWQTAPGGTGMLLPQLRTDRTGGTTGTASRTNLIIAIRNI
jgi:hypothetical protein